MGEGSALKPDVAERVSAIVKLIVDEDFDGNRTDASVALGFSQAQVSDLYNRRTGKAGLATVVALRNYLRVPIDEILGLAVLNGPPRRRLPRAPDGGIRPPRTVDEALRDAEQTIATLRQEIASAPRVVAPPSAAAQAKAKRVERKRTKVRELAAERQLKKKARAAEDAAPANVSATGTDPRRR